MNIFVRTAPSTAYGSGWISGCLGNDDEVSLKDALRSGISNHGLLELIREAMLGKRAEHQMQDGFVPLTKMIGIGG